MPAIGGGNIPAFSLAPDAVCLHKQTHTLLAHPQASAPQLVIDAWPAVFLLHFAVDGTDMYQELLIWNTGWAGYFPRALPAVKTAFTDCQHPAHRPNR